MSDADQPNERTSQPDGAPGGPALGSNADAVRGDERGVEALVVLCPYCHAQDVELLALFGAQLLTDQYYCNACHTPFEHVRDS
ncbi:MAG TPA: hypothetical protein VMV29_12410 [Ktedonobacterales bacterium]|nr:hypothetical protein [Ktedonobacterales bacterium]